MVTNNQSPRQAQRSERELKLILFGAITKRYRLGFIGVMLVNMVSAIFEVISIGSIVPFVMILVAPEKLYDYEPVRDFSELWGLSDANELIVPVTVGFLLATVIAMLVRLGSIKLNARFAFSLGSDLSLKAYQGALSRPYADYKAINSSEDLAKLVPKVNTLVQSLIFPFVMLVSAILMFMVIAAVFIVIDYEIALSVFVGLAVIYLAITRFFKNKLKYNSVLLSKLQNLQVKIAQESIGGIKEVILGDSRKYFIEAYRNVDVALRSRQSSNIVIAQAPRYLVESLSIIFIVVLVFYYVYISETISREIVLPVIVTIAVGLQRILPISQQAYRSWANIEGNKQSLYDVIDMIKNGDLNICTDSSTYSRLEFCEQIKISNVKYSHAHDSNFELCGINLIIQKGEKIGFIGGTGSGKSTLIDVVMGLLSPDQGEVSIDGHILNAANIKSWYNYIAHVPQHVYILDSDFYTNIAFGDTSKSINKSRAEWAAEIACVDTFVKNRTKGYESLAGERGAKLSGGQMQRLGIARCLYKASSLIVLDEATSALDSDTEEKVMSNIYNLNQTVLIIAHRLSSLRGCDRIVELESGRIKRMGTYEEIIGTGLSRERLQKSPN